MINEGFTDDKINSEEAADDVFNAKRTVLLVILLAMCHLSYLQSAASLSCYQQITRE